MVPLKIVVLGEFVDAAYLKDSSVSNEIILIFNFIARQVSVTDELLARLVDLEI